MVILRKQPNGETRELIGGFYSSVLSKHKRAWLPCEGEAAAIRLVLEHFRHFIRESNHTTVHFTDSQPCVLAWKRSCRGAFSSSARISTFLVGLSSLPIELRHKAGKQMHTSDYASRHPQTCSFQRCQICSFVKEWENIGDSASDIRTVSFDDVKTGRSIMPLTQKSAWKNIQKRDPIHIKLLDLINTQQLPETKKTNGIHTKLKLLHNQYTLGKLFVDKEGLVMIKNPEGEFNGAVISVPPALFPGVVSALHLQLDHPSRSQLGALLGRYFYTPGWKSIVDDICDNCHQCLSLRKLPKVLIEDSSHPPSGLATNFAADVVERNCQKILVVRENLSLYTKATFIPDQKAETLKIALLQLLLDIIPETGAHVRVDAAPGFQTLLSESSMDNSLLKKFNVKIVIGRTLNKNKNPTVENANQEIQKEILKLTNRTGPITDIELAQVLRNMNSRIRFHGYTAKEVLYRRNLLDNNPIQVKDESINKSIQQNREKSSKSSRTTKLKTHAPTPQQTFFVGDLVFVRGSRNKNNPREMYIIEDTEDQYFLIRKFNTKLRQRLYKALPQELILAPTPNSDNMVKKQDRSNYILDETSSSTSPSEVTEFSDIFSPAGRPIRKAARKAHGICSLANVKPKWIHKPGWLEEDQPTEWELVTCYDLLHSETLEVSPSSSIAPTSTSSYDNDSLSSGTEEDMIWDDSPSQIELSTSGSLDNPPTTSSNRQIPPRRHAISEQNLTRSDAFKCPPDTTSVKPPAPVVPQPTLHFFRSRIPKPRSISDVDTTQVTDISSLPIPRNPHHSYNLRRSQAGRPSSYKDYHATGRR